MRSTSGVSLDSGATIPSASTCWASRASRRSGRDASVRRRVSSSFSGAPPYDQGGATKQPALIIASASVALLGFVLLTRMHERYMFTAAARAGARSSSYGRRGLPMSACQSLFVNLWFLYAAFNVRVRARGTPLRTVVRLDLRKRRHEFVAEEEGALARCRHDRDDRRGLRPAMGATILGDVPRWPGDRPRSRTGAGSGAGCGPAELGAQDPRAEGMTVKAAMMVAHARARSPSRATVGSRFERGSRSETVRDPRRLGGRLWPRPRARDDGAWRELGSSVKFSESAPTTSSGRPFTSA